MATNDKAYVVWQYAGPPIAVISHPSQALEAISDYMVCSYSPLSFVLDDRGNEVIICDWVPFFAQDQKRRFTFYVNATRKYGN